MFFVTNKIKTDNDITVVVRMLSGFLLVFDSKMLTRYVKYFGGFLLSKYKETYFSGLRSNYRLKGDVLSL